MSRGPGRWQREIINIVENNGYLVMPPRSASHYNALHRAALRLADLNRVQIIRARGEDDAGRNVIRLMVLNADIDRDFVDPVSNREIARNMGCSEATVRRDLQHLSDDAATSDAQSSLTRGPAS
jgi:DeoR-like helix-turn-helix domain